MFFATIRKEYQMKFLSQTMDAVKQSWTVLKADRELLVFPALSGLLCLIVSASFYFPIAAAGSGLEGMYAGNKAAFFVLMFLFYFANYFLITFFNCAVIACAEIRMAGGDPTLADGFRASLAVTSYIAAWAMIEATVGVILKTLSRKGRRGLVTASLGTMWTMAAFFVPPRMVIERTDPFTALKSAWKDLKGNWGHQLAGGVSFGLLGFAASIPALLVLFAFGTPGFLAVAFAGVGILVVSLVISTLTAVFLASLYLSMWG